MGHVITLPSSHLLEIRRIPKFLSVWYTILLRLGNTSDPFYSEKTSVHSHQEKMHVWYTTRWQRWFSFCGRPPWGLGVERLHLRGMMSSSGRKEYMQYLVKPGKEISACLNSWMVQSLIFLTCFGVPSPICRAPGHRGTALGIWILNTTSVASLLPRSAWQDPGHPSGGQAGPHLLRLWCTLYIDKMWSINLYTMYVYIYMYYTYCITNNRVTCI